MERCGHSSMGASRHILPLSRRQPASQGLRRSAAFLFDLELLGQNFCLHHDLAMLTNPVTMRQRASQLPAEKAVAGLLE